jgi:heptaprenyl diphosphate synthase
MFKNGMTGEGAASKTEDAQQRIRRLVFMAMLVCLAMVLSYIERFIPLNYAVPGIKLGLANLVILTGMYVLPFTSALSLVLLKCVMTAWIFGSFSAFLYSLGGSVLSFGLMSLLLYGSHFKLNILAVSVAGAIGHNLGQILLAALVMGSDKVFYYLPVLAATGIVTGLVIGAGAKAVLPYLQDYRGRL